MSTSIELDSKALNMVQLAVAQCLVGQLDRILPKMVEEVLIPRDSYKTNFVAQAVKNAVEEELAKQIAEALAGRREVIAALVARSLEVYLDLPTIAETVASQLQGLKIPVYPFKKKAASQEDDE